MANGIQKWDPIREFERLHDEVDRLFRGNWPFRTTAPVFEGYPFLVDIVEDSDEIRLSAEIPGMDSKDVSISVENNVLNISGEKKMVHDEKKDNVLRSERYYGKFSRSFTLPNYVDSDKIDAEYKDGVLVLHLPKKPETKPRQIQVKTK